MNCPYCGEPILEQYRYCPRCARQLSQQTVYSQEPSAAVSSPEIPAKKGRLWVPLVIMVLIFAAGFSLFLFTHSYQSGYDTSMPWFSVKNGTLCFDGNLYTGGEVLDVPSAIGGQTVTALSTGCFQNCNFLVSVNLPDTLQTVNDGAFSNCSRLRGVLLPDQVTYIGSSVFSGCTALEALSIPAGVTQIGADAFSGCDTLMHIFYTGTKANWKALFSGKSGAYTCVYASDGKLYVGYEAYPFG